MNKKVRWGIVGATAVTIIGIGMFTINESNYSKQVEAVASEHSTNDQVVLELKKQMNTLYLDDSKVFLSEEISQQKIDLLLKNLKKYSETSQAYSQKIENLRKNDQKKYQFNVNNLSVLQDETKMIQQKLQAQDAVNNLFQTAYLKGSTENKEVTLIDDLTVEKIDEVREKFAQAVDEKDDTKKFEVAINAGIEVAQKQLNQIAKARKAINELYRDEKVTDKTTKETLESAKKEVEQIKNKKAKESFNGALTAIEEKVKADEEYKQKLEAEKQAEEAKRQAEEAEKQALQEADTTQSSVDHTPATETPTTIVEVPTDQSTVPSTSPPSGNGGATTNNSNSSPENVGGSNTGGSSNSGGSGGTTGGTTPPTPPVQEKPYALNPYTGSGTKYMSYALAAEAGEKWMMESTNTTGGYRVYTEYWSDGTVIYYLELY